MNTFFLTTIDISYYEILMEVSEKKLNTVGKAIGVIETIFNKNRPLSIKEIAEALGYNKSSLHHHIKTLTEMGYLQKDDETRKYDIGLSLVRAGQSYLQRVNVRERGHFYLEELSRNLSETVHLLVLDNKEAVYVDKVDVNHQPGALKCSSFIGLRTDLYSTAAGKVLLAHLERGALETIIKDLEMKPKTNFTITDKTKLLDDLELVKQRGYSLDLQEHALGMQCISVPVLNHHSQCVAAISVSCSTAIIARNTLENEILSELRETGKKVSVAMGYSPSNSYQDHS